MTMVRKTVTLDADAVAGATKLAGGNFSAYVNDALMYRLRRDQLKALVEEDIRRRGPIPEERAAATLASIKAVEAGE